MCEVLRSNHTLTSRPTKLKLPQKRAVKRPCEGRLPQESLWSLDCFFKSNHRRTQAFTHICKRIMHRYTLNHRLPAPASEKTRPGTESWNEEETSSVGGGQLHPEGSWSMTAERGRDHLDPADRKHHCWVQSPLGTEARAVMEQHPSQPTRDNSQLSRPPKEALEVTTDGVK